MCTHHSFLPKDPGSSSPSPRAQSPPRHPPDTLYKSFLPSESSPIPLSLGLGFYELTLHFIPPWGLRWDLQGDTRGWKEQGQKGLSLESGEEAPPPLLPHLWKSPLGRLPLKLPIARVHRQTSSQGNTQTPQAQRLTGTDAPASPGHSGAGLTARLTQTHAVDPRNHTLRGTHARTQTLGAT